MLIEPSGRLLLLPVETAARELDAKLLLALFAARAGVRVVIGSHTILNMNLHRLPRGTYLLHTVNRPRRRIVRILSELGHRIEAWDEEGLVWLNADVYAQRRLDAEVLRHVARFHAWGEEQARAMRAAGVSDGVVLAGNPRADLLRPPLIALHAERARALKARYGDFILVNSNFGWLNYALAKDVTDREAHLRAIAARSGHPLGYLRYRQRVFESFLDLVPALARAYPERHIIVRPHPSENPKAWRKASAGRANVHVIYDSHLLAWLSAAGALIHNACTTAVEFALMGRAPISFDVVRDAEWETPQPAAVSLSAVDVDEVIELVKTPLDLPAKQAASLAEMIVTAEGETSAERIATEIARRVPPAAGPRLFGRVRAGWRSVGKRIAALHPRSSSHASYVAKKVPDMEGEDVSERLERMAGLLRLESPLPKVRKLMPRLYVIESG